MITAKDLAPLDDTLLELWRNTIKHRKDKTLWALYCFCQSCKLTMVEVRHELLKRRFQK